MDFKFFDNENNKSAVNMYAYDYVLNSFRSDGFPNDPLARFHLGNGAVLKRIHLKADLSAKALKEEAGIMINYKYDLNDVEKNHEEHVKNQTVFLSTDAKTILSKPNNMDA